MKIAKLLVVTIVMVLYGCAGTLAGSKLASAFGLDDRQTTYTAEVQRDFSARDRPAERRVIRDDDELLGKGYAFIGHIESVYVARRCYAGTKGPECTDISGFEEQERDLLKAAARHGGDVVVLMSGSRRSSRSIHKSACKEFSTSRTTATVWNPATLHYEQGYVRDKYCSLHEKVPGFENILTLRGGVFRQEPELARDQAATWRLISAVKRGDQAEVTRLLLRSGDINRSYHGHKVFNEAAAAGHVEIAKVLLGRGADINGEDDLGTPPHRAAAEGQVAMVRFLLDRGVPVDRPTTLGAEHLVGMTPLFHAAKGGHPQAVQLLLARGANPNHRSGKGLTPLMWAATSKDANTVNALLAVGGKINDQSEPIPAVGMITTTPLVWAVAFNNGDAAAELLLRGAKLDAKLSKTLTVEDFIKDKSDFNALVTGYKEGVYGYVNKQDQLVVVPQFIAAEDFLESVAVVRVGNRFGLIDRSGRLVVSARFVRLDSFKDGLALASEDDVSCGYIDRTGRWVIEPRFSWGREFSEGLAPVSIGDKKVGTKWTYIDKRGNFIAEPGFNNAFAFKDGIAAVKVGNNERYIDRHGKFVGGKYDVVGHFTEGMGRVQDGSEWGFVDISGKYGIKPQFDLALPFAEGLAVVRVAKDKYGYIDKTGKLVVTPQYHKAESFSEGRAAVKTAVGKWGYIDRTGTLVVPANYEEARPFSEGLAAVRLVTQTADGKSVRYLFGYVDKQGRTAIPPQFNAAELFKEGVASVMNASWDRGYVDRTGKFVIKPRFNQAGEFSAGLARVRSKDKAAWVAKWKEVRRRDADLLSAADRGDAQKVAALMDAGANIETRDAAGDTPLIRAASKGHAAAIRVLLARGAYPIAQNDLGETAFDVANAAGRQEAATILLLAQSRALVRGRPDSDAKTERAPK